MHKELEKDIQLAICHYLELKRIFFWRQNVAPVPYGDGRKFIPKFAAIGVPDILVIHKGRFMGLEVKRKDGKLRPSQEDFRERCVAAGGEYHIVRSIDDVQKLGL